jgi:hypothetical protein
MDHSLLLAHSTLQFSILTRAEQSLISFLSHGKVCLACRLMMALCCSFHFRSSAPVAAPADSSASIMIMVIALPVGHFSSIGVAQLVRTWSLVGLFCVECVVSLSALPELTLLQLSSCVLTGSPTRGGTDTVRQCASCWLWGERSFHASWPLRSSLGRCWSAVGQPAR